MTDHEKGFVQYIEFALDNGFSNELSPEDLQKYNSIIQNEKEQQKTKC